MNKIRCSVPILTLNSKVGLERLLPVLVESFEDVFIVDGNSTDGTPEYAMSLGVRVERQSDVATPNLRVTHFAQAREHSWSLAKCDWIYWIDSDEVPTPELIESVRRIVDENDSTAIHHYVRVVRLPDGRLVRHAFFYPEYVPRLFHRASGVSLVDRAVHERFIVPKTVRSVRHSQTFVAPWSEPSVLWRKHLGYLELDRLEPSPRWSALFRWVIGYNVRSLVGQFLRAVQSTVVGALNGETALPWAYNWLFFKYRLVRIKDGIREWRTHMRMKPEYIPIGICAFLKKNRLFLVCAVLVGFVSIAPHALRVHAIGSAYEGIPHFSLDDEDHYLVRIHEIIDGHWAVGSPYYFEYKKFPSAFPPVGEFVFYALPSLLFRIPLTSFFVASKFLYPAVLFFLIAVFVRRLTGGGAEASRNATVTSIAAGLLATIGYGALDTGSIARFFLESPISSSNVWTRPVNPIAGALFLFPALLLTFSLIRKRRWTIIVIIGTLVALSASGFFSWVILLAVLALMACAYALRGERRIRNDVLFALAIGTFGSAIVLWPTLRSVLRHGDPGVGALRIGAEFTRVPVWSLTVVGSLVLFVIFTFVLWRRNRASGFRGILKEDWWVMCASLLFGSLLAFSEQLITGITVWPAHFVQYAKPLSVIAVLTVGSHAIGRRLPRAWTAAMVIGIALSGVVGARTLIPTPEDIRAFRAAQDDAPLYAWLNANAPKDCVVFVNESGERITRAISAFTACNVYVSPWLFSGIPDERIRHNFFVMLRSDGVTSETFEPYLRSHVGLLSGYFAADWTTRLNGNPDDAWTSDRVAELAPQYADFLKKDFSDRLREYRIDYVFIEENNASLASMDIPGLSELATFENGTLYRL